MSVKGEIEHITTLIKDSYSRSFFRRFSFYLISNWEFIGHLLVIVSMHFLISPLSSESNSSIIEIVLIQYIPCNVTQVDITVRQSGQNLFPSSSSASAIKQSRQVWWPQVWKAVHLRFSFISSKQIGQDAFSSSFWFITDFGYVKVLSRWN